MYIRIPLFLVLSLFAVFLCLPFHSADARPRHNQKEDKEKEKDKGNDHWVTINPGFTLESVTLNISGPSAQSSMSQSQLGKTNWMLDVRSNDLVLGEYWGINLLVHNGNFVLNRQNIANPSPTGAGTSSNSSNNPSSNYSQGPGGNSGYSTVDMGTILRGQYSYVIPAIYFGQPGLDHHKFGFGIGPGWINLSGSTYFNSGVEYGISSLAGSDPNKFVQTMGQYNVLSGVLNASNAPILSYLMLTASANNQNLDLLGLYLISKGLLSTNPQAPFLYYYLTEHPSLTPLQFFTLNSLSSSFVKVHAKSVGTFMFFYETPRIYGIKFRLSFGGPVFKAGSFSYQLTSIQFSTFVPIALF